MPKNDSFAHETFRYPRCHLCDAQPHRLSQATACGGKRARIATGEAHPSEMLFHELCFRGGLWLFFENDTVFHGHFISGFD